MIPARELATSVPLNIKEYRQGIRGNVLAGLSCSDNCKANTAAADLADLFAGSADGPSAPRGVHWWGIVDHGKGIGILCLRIRDNPEGCVKVAGGRSLRRPPDQSAKRDAPRRGCQTVVEGLK